MLYTMRDVAEVKVYPTPPEQMGLPAYDHTRLNAVNTCPRYGLVRYIHHKTFSEFTGRALALEAGQACHDAYAALRLYQIGVVQGYRDHMHHWGSRLLKETWDDVAMVLESGEDAQTNIVNVALAAFAGYGYYDDPQDTRRTVTNIEEALIAYASRFDMRRNVWIKNPHDPTDLVGVEIPIDVIVHMVDSNGNDVLRIRYIGKADGVSSVNGRIVLEENKTASRLGDAWAMAFHTSHQVTGYMMGLGAMLDTNVERALVHGMCIPLPRSYDYGGLMTETVTRGPAQIMHWFEWILHSVQIIEMYRDRPLDAPMNTGSCNKFFRPCSMIPLCAEPDPSEQEDAFKSMATDKWDPLADDIETPGSA